MQRGLGGFPHERLHQDKAQLSYGKFKPLAIASRQQVSIGIILTEVPASFAQRGQTRPAWPFGQGQSLCQKAVRAA
ncbi:MAG: hypothetical protein F6J98_36050 [Moorea sp. SIO4G2]|nr:hypothetical protein [Moorena sp. SIO4G2]